MDALIFLLGVAITILMVAAPFLVIIAVVATIGFGLISLIRGIRTARLKHTVIGAIFLIAGTTLGLTLLTWSTTQPPKGETSSPHAYVHHAWEQTQLRFQVWKWMADGTFGRLAQEQQDGRADRERR